MHTTLPAVFVGHGSPMNTLEHNRFTQAWYDLGRSMPTPRAILAISAHWYINATAVTAMAAPRTMHDFYGFPQQLFDFEYPAPGDPGLADQIIELVAPRWVGRDEDSWGLDHGTWSVLAHMFPDADVPVVQVSVDATKRTEDHLALGAALEPLRHDGVLVVASGNVVHNLRAIDWSRPEGGYDWADAYDDAARELMTSDPGAIGRLAERADHHLATPTPDHLLPLFPIAGIAAATGGEVEIPVGGTMMGSLSMTCFVVR